MTTDLRLPRSFSRHELAAFLPYPALDAHKYSRGRLFIIAGSARYPGAACLAAAASQRVGAGYTQVFAAPESVPVIQAFRPSLVVAPWRDLPEWLPASTAERPCALVIGPGLTDSDETTELLGYALRAEMPVLIDGGALAVLAADTDISTMIPEREDAGLATVLTPHVGEALRLAEPFGELSRDLESASQELSDVYHATVLLKGPDTCVACGPEIAVMTDGTAALAKAGTGDVLAGMVGALLAQGSPTFEAVYLGAYLHAHAGRIAAVRTHEISATPEDVIEAIPRAIVELSE